MLSVTDVVLLVCTVTMGVHVLMWLFAPTKAHKEFYAGGIVGAAKCFVAVLAALAVWRLFQ